MAQYQHTDGLSLDPDHPSSDLWPEVFSNGREVFSDDYYQIFPWGRETDPFDEDTENPTSVNAFINGLISLELDDLPDDDQNCPICITQYRSGELEEMPLELPCGHVVGKDCLYTWLSSFAGLEDEMPHNNCPTCRRELISEKRMSIATVEGLAQRLRDTNYHLHALGRPLKPEWALRWEHIQQYVKAYIKEQQNCRKLEQLQEDRYRMFMEVMRKSVQDMWKVHIISRPELAQQLAERRDRVLSSLDMLGRQGTMEGYLAQQSDTDADKDWDIEVVEMQLREAPYNLGTLINDTFRKRLAGKQPYDQQWQSDFARKLVLETEDFAVLDAELKDVRYHQFLAIVKDEILGPALRKYVPFRGTQEEEIRVAAGTALTEIHRQGNVRAWLERADLIGPDSENHSGGQQGDISRLLECIVNNVYKTRFFGTR